MSESAKANAESPDSALLAAAPYLLPVVIAILFTCLQNPAILVILLTDGAWPVGIVISAAGWGAWPAKRLARDSRNRGQEIVIAAAIGFGILAAATLTLGVLGLLNRATALALIAGGAALGISRLASKAESQADLGNRYATSNTMASGTLQQLARFAVLLPLAIPLYVALSGATLPPSILWREEAGGYDVLEYHLQVQREYFDCGRITLLPHNVYASFPQQVEILSLLLMHLAGSPIDAAIPAQLLHVLFGGLALAAFAAWLPAGWPRVCGVAVLGTTPWLAYLGCLAYVENGMLFFSAVAFGIVAAWVRGQTPTIASALLAGLCAGMAGGCKYTALVFVAGAGALTAFFAIRQPLPLKLRCFGVFFAATLAGVSPWLIRNVTFTGNPVYPLLYSLFGGAGWSAEQANQWSRGHAISGGRAQTALTELFLGKFGGFEQPRFGATLFGPLPLAFGLGFFCLAATMRVALGDRNAVSQLGQPEADVPHFPGPPNVSRTPREAIFWMALATIIAIAWALGTQVAGRLAIPIVIPFAALVALAADRHRKIGIGVALAASICGAAILQGTWTDANRDWERRVGVALRDLAGQSQLFVQNHPYNAMLPRDARIRLVGDAAVFYIQRPLAYFTAFDRDPWLKEAAGLDSRAAVRWLDDRGVTHVVFNWGEIERLRRTYGFSDRVSREWVRELEQKGLKRLAIPPEWAASSQSIDIYSISRQESSSIAGEPTNLTMNGGSEQTTGVARKCRGSR